jgi:sugar phosphate isomerase/epimerase
LKTRTGNFPIGFRRGWSDWQKKDLKSLAAWAAQSGFEALDLGRVGSEEMSVLKSTGLGIGSADLLDFGGIMATDAGKRRDAVARNSQYVKEAAAVGAKVFFTVLIPGDPSAKRRDNYRLAIECYAPICEAAAGAGAFVAIEGWPGIAPWYANLCCSPETLRAFFKEIPRGSALNYDPSHLIRIGIDHIRFLKEFIPHVRHVHAKDTASLPEAQYELGLYQDSIFSEPHGFGEHVWRHTVPGQGIARWGEILQELVSARYQGVISVELEDENFNTDEKGEKAGLMNSLNFLSGV